MSIIGFLGDIHGKWGILDEAIWNAASHKAEVLIQVGDFGLISKNIFEEYALQAILEDSPIPVWIIDGNHDDCTYLCGLPDTHVHYKLPNLFYQKRGSVRVIDGVRIGFFGGATSINKRQILEAGWFWDPMESITPEDTYHMMQHPAIDILVSHTPPQSVLDSQFDPLGKLKWVGVDWIDQSAVEVESVWEHFGKPLNISGHMHHARAAYDGSFRVLAEHELFLLDTNDFRADR